MVVSSINNNNKKNKNKKTSGTFMDPKKTHKKVVTLME